MSASGPTRLPSAHWRGWQASAARLPPKLPRPGPARTVARPPAGRCGASAEPITLHNTLAAAMRTGGQAAAQSLAKGPPRQQGGTLPELRRTRDGRWGLRARQTLAVPAAGRHARRRRSGRMLGGAGPPAVLYTRVLPTLAATPAPPGERPGENARTAPTL